VFVRKMQAAQGFVGERQSGAQILSRRMLMGRLAGREVAGVRLTGANRREVFRKRLVHRGL